MKSEIPLNFPQEAGLASLCESAARAGGQALIDWGGRFQAREKSAADLVTDADLASQEAIRAKIAAKFPDHVFLGEEGAGSDLAELAGEKRPCWIVDPLDGTTNYVHGFPFFSVSVAVALGEQILAGVIYNPLTEDCFQAVRGGGASLNGSSLMTSDVERMSQSLVAVSFPPGVHEDNPDLRNFLSVVGKTQAVRRTGSCALNLAHLAVGQLDAFWAHSIQPWDVAAGILLIREAGGVVSACDGGPFKLWDADFLAASTGPLHQELLSSFCENSSP